jgi:ribulose-phosphate 3-epimerase
MGVHPGKEHQSFVPEVLNKIKEIKKTYPNTTVQVDGGVTDITAKQLKEVGCDIINTGSFVSSNDNPKEALKQLEEVFK